MVKTAKRIKQITQILGLLAIVTITVQYLKNLMISPPEQTTYLLLEGSLMALSFLYVTAGVIQTSSELSKKIVPKEKENQELDLPQPGVEL